MNDEIQAEQNTEEMTCESRDKTGFWAWVKAHKKQLIMAGLSITAIVGIILGIKNKDALMELWSSLEKSLKGVDKSSPILPTINTVEPTIESITIPRSHTSPQVPFDVNQHIRTLSGGRQHSAEKAAQAAAMGIALLPNETLVNSYTKCVAA